jgi:hypothetical protein
MKKFLIAISVIMLIATSTYAQVTPPPIPTSTSKFLAWDQDASSLIEAQGLTYKYYADSSTTGVVLPNVTCIGTASPFQCQVAFPAFTPGVHTLAITASNIAGESVKSIPPLNFSFVVIPGTPRNITIK